MSVISTTNIRGHLTILRGHLSLFALKQLATASNRASRIPLDQIDRGLGRGHIAAPGADLLFERLTDRPTRDSWAHLGFIDKLRR